MAQGFPGTKLKSVILKFFRHSIGFKTMDAETWRRGLKKPPENEAIDRPQLRNFPGKTATHGRNAPKSPECPKPVCAGGFRAQQQGRASRLIAKRALMRIPSLEDYERKLAARGKRRFNALATLAFYPRPSRPELKVSPPERHPPAGFIIGTRQSPAMSRPAS